MTRSSINCVPEEKIQDQFSLLHIIYFKQKKSQSPKPIIADFESEFSLFKSELIVSFQRFLNAIQMFSIFNFAFFKSFSFYGVFFTNSLTVLVFASQHKVCLFLIYVLIFHRIGARINVFIFKKNERDDPTGASRALPNAKITGNA